MSVEIREVTSKKELKKFVKFNIELYKGNPYHVPGLIEEEMMTLDKKKNPAFEVCDAIYFLAYKDGKVEGIITDGDVRRAMESSQNRFFTLSVKDIMTKNPVTISPDTKISMVEKIMQDRKIHAVLVVDENGKLMGIVDSFRTMI